MNVIEFIRFVAMLIIAGALIRVVELKWGGKPGILGQVPRKCGCLF